MAVKVLVGSRCKAAVESATAAGSAGPAAIDVTGDHTKKRWVERLGEGLRRPTVPATRKR
jgi:hypothetical protein